VLDFGSGTGVLAFVALRSGAASACGIDIDPVSVAAARHNAELNGLAEHTEFALPNELAARDFDVVVANVEAPALLAVASEVTRWATRAKCLILTGFLTDRAPEMVAAFAPAFRAEREETEDDWALLELVPRG
jgi:ribosomal protein L11 methyltransferase